MGISLSTEFVLRLKWGTPILNNAAATNQGSDLAIQTGQSNQENDHGSHKIFVVLRYSPA
jgi:hypothetical protein